jgi:ABC-type transporter Mla MlaB component
VQLGHNGHACWGYADEQDFQRAAADFLADGLELGQRLLYISGAPQEHSLAALAPLGDVQGLIDRGALKVARLEDFYDVGRPIDTAVQLAKYAAATEQACGEGYTGLRVAADATALVADPHLREAHLRWESVADRYMAANPLAALCAYHERFVPAELIADLQSVHPLSRDGREPPFRLSYLDGETLSLEGEVDVFTAPDLARVLDVTLLDSEPPRALDLRTLRFVDHHGVATLIDTARRHTLEIQEMPALARRLAELLDAAAS